MNNFSTAQHSSSANIQHATLQLAQCCYRRPADLCVDQNVSALRRDFSLTLHTSRLLDYKYGKISGMCCGSLQNLINPDPKSTYSPPITNFNYAANKQTNRQTNRGENSTAAKSGWVNCAGSLTAWRLMSLMDGQLCLVNHQPCEWVHNSTRLALKSWRGGRLHRPHRAAVIEKNLQQQ